MFKLFCACKKNVVCVNLHRGSYIYDDRKKVPKNSKKKQEKNKTRVILFETERQGRLIAIFWCV